MSHKQQDFICVPVCSVCISDMSELMRILDYSHLGQEVRLCNEGLYLIYIFPYLHILKGID